MIDLDTRVKDIGGAMLRRGPRLGIELEYENFRGDELDGPYKSWNFVNDPSLRDGGMELVSHILQPGAVKAAMKEAEEIIRLSHAEAHERCGVHIHVNVSDLTLRRLWNFITLYVLVEPSLFKQYADGRQNNHFCVPLYSNAVLAQALYDDIRALRGSAVPTVLKRDMFGRPRRKNGLGITNCIKYSALNLKPITSLGTVELRLFPGTRDVETITEWARIVLKLRKVAVQTNDPLDVVEDYENYGLDALRDKLGLENVEVDPIDQEEAVDVATMAAGYIAKTWEELNWEIN